jgi:metal-dependent amidase/aminoacylase/carboxypeptidase family protein
MFSDYTRGCFGIRAKNMDDLAKLKHDVIKCFEGAALSTKCEYSITERRTYKGSPNPVSES